MTPAELITKMEKARKLLEAMPPEVDVICLKLHYADGSSYLQLYNSVNALVAGNFISSECAKARLPSTADYDKWSIATSGIEIFEMLKIENAAPGGATPEAAEGQSPKDTSIISRTEVEVK